jgi:hypothetical protein
MMAKLSAAPLILMLEWIAILSLCLFKQMKFTFFTQRSKQGQELIDMRLMKRISRLSKLNGRSWCPKTGTDMRRGSAKIAQSKGCQASFVGGILT